MTSLLTTIRSSVPALLLLFVLFAGGAYAGTFTEPVGTPTGGDVSLPLNLGGTAQTKSGGIWADSIGGSNGFTFGTNSAWFTSSSKSTLVTQQYCIGTDVNNVGNDSCVTSLTGGGAAHCQLQRDLIEEIPGGTYFWPIEDYCAAALTGSGIAGHRASDGWVATGEDGCAEYGGDGDNCNGIGHGPLQCDYVRLVCDGTPIPQTSNVLRHQ